MRRITAQVRQRRVYDLWDQDERTYLHELDTQETILLAKLCFIEGHIPKTKDTLVHVRLLVSRSKAYRELRNARIGSVSADRPTITKNVAKSGSMHWRERLDRSDSGLTGSNRTVFIGKRVNLGVAAA